MAPPNCFSRVVMDFIRLPGRHVWVDVRYVEERGVWRDGGRGRTAAARVKLNRVRSSGTYFAAVVKEASRPALEVTKNSEIFVATLFLMLSAMPVWRFPVPSVSMSMLTQSSFMVPCSVDPCTFGQWE